MSGPKIRAIQHGVEARAEVSEGGEESAIHKLHESSAALRQLLKKRAERQRQYVDGGIAELEGVNGGGEGDAVVVAGKRPLAPSVPAEIVQAKKMAKVRFWMKIHVDYGQRVCLVGSVPELGSWVLADSVAMEWSEGDMWNAVVELPAGGVLEYKYVVVGQGGHAVSWQSGNNSVLAVALEDEELEVHDNWGGAPGAKVVTSGDLPVTREKKLLSWATELESQVIQQRQELRRVRMELLAAQEEARLARDEAKKLKDALAKSEADRVKSARTMREVEAVNNVLKEQIQDTTSSFRQALEIAVDILDSSSSSSTARAAKSKSKSSAKSK